MDKHPRLRVAAKVHCELYSTGRIRNKPTQSLAKQYRFYSVTALPVRRGIVNRKISLNPAPWQVTRCNSTYAQNSGKKYSLPDACVVASTSRNEFGNSQQSHQGDSSMASLTGFIEEMDQIAPRFELDDFEDEGGGAIDGCPREGIDVIEGPTEFYKILKTKISQANRRIYLSTLYVGKTEHELISTIQTALKNNDNLTISFLADALRGTRESPESTTASLLAPLVAEFGPERVRIRMFHTPNLTGVKKRVLPQRINEGWGLQHMKLYGIDDEVILSGANLSEDYFTNRLDRYHVFRSKSLTDYYEKIHEAISSISFDIQPDETSKAGYRMIWPSSNEGPNPLDGSKAYIAHASSLVSSLISPSPPPNPPQNGSSPSRSRTYVYPIFQLTPLLPGSTTQQSKHLQIRSQQSTELPALTSLLLALTKAPFHPAQLTFTAGYFNPSPSLVQLLLDTQQLATPSSATTKPSLDVLAASPYANGFYKSPGISGLLPPAYTLLCRRFLEQAHKRGIAETTTGKPGSVRLSEWRRGTVGEKDGWTYHAKGIWVTLPVPPPPASISRSNSAIAATSDEQSAAAEPGPTITLIGSSNYTQRSYSLDLEANALVLTRNPKLQARLREEVEWLKKDASEMKLEDYQRTERRVSLAVRVAMWITRVVGGAL